MNYSNIIEEINRKYKIASKIDMNEKICLKINGSLEVFLEHSPYEQVFFLSTPVFEIHSATSKEFYKKLLSFNLFGNLTGSAFLCIDEVKNCVLLMERFEEKEADFNFFEEKLQQFVTSADTLKEKIVNLDFEPSIQAPEEFQKLPSMRKI